MRVIFFRTKGVIVTDICLNKLSGMLPPESFASLAIQLRFPYSVYASIQTKNVDMRNSFLELLQKWKMNTGGLEHDLEKALEEIECGSLVEIYKQT